MFKNNKRKIFISLIVLVCIGVIGVFAGTKTIQTVANNSANTRPTFYFHGFGGTANSTNSMISYSEKNYQAHKVFTANVDPSGKVSLVGNWSGRVKRPIVQVLFKNNHNGNYHQDAQWIKNVMQAVEAKHHFSTYNIVAHSMGNLGFMYYVLFEQSTFNSPKLINEVNIAGHFDGILGMDDKPNKNSLLPNGKPKILNKNYKEMLANRNNYPEDQVNILNIYGNLENGTNSDGDVSNVSSKSLWYLTRDRTKSYTEMMFTGPNAQHSHLHGNPAVAKAFDNFLYQ